MPTCITMMRPDMATALRPHGQLPPVHSTTTNSATRQRRLLLKPAFIRQPHLPRPASPECRHDARDLWDSASTTRPPKEVGPLTTKSMALGGKPRFDSAIERHSAGRARGSAVSALDLSGRNRPAKALTLHSRPIAKQLSNPFFFLAHKWSVQGGGDVASPTIPVQQLPGEPLRHTREALTV